MKVSRYNHFASLEDSSVLAFNSLTGALLRLEARRHASFQEILEGISSGRPLESKATALFTEMRAGGFVIPADFDELGYLKLTNRVSRYNTDTLNLTIAPTMACNLNCFYCYEHKDGSFMSREVQDQVVRFVEEEAKRIYSLSVTWYGGEPLLAKKAIYHLSERFIQTCHRYQRDYSASIITNGVLLKAKVARRLKDLGVAFAQVTLDGVGKVHDQRRPFLRGRGSFDIIIRNLVDAANVLSIVLRVNIDSTNTDSAKEIVHFLAQQGLRDKISFDFAPIHADGKGCSDLTGKCPQLLLNTKRFSDLEMELYELAASEGFSPRSVPQPRSHSCCAVAMNTYVIEPSGALHKCWVTAGDSSEVVGNVATGTPLGGKVTKWLTFDPFEIEDCRDCSIMPLCMHQCPNKFFRSGELPCPTWKFSLAEVLRLFYKQSKDEEPRDGRRLSPQLIDGLLSSDISSINSVSKLVQIQAPACK